MLPSIALTVGLLAGALAPANTHASTPLDPIAARFRSLNSANGLSQDTALSMAEDSHGFVWVGTQDGLNRFDGHEVRVFRAGKAQGSLGSNWIDSLCVDTRQSLWVGTSAGLFRYDEASERFQRVEAADQPETREQFVHDLLCEADGSVWVAGSEGLGKVLPDGDSLQMLSAPGAESDRRTRALARDDQGHLWIGSFEGLSCLDSESSPPRACGQVDALRGMPINTLLLDPVGKLWVGTDRAGLYRVEPSTQQAEPMFTGQGDDPFRSRVVALHWDQDTGLWLGSEVGAYRVLNYDSDSPTLQGYPHRAHDPFSPGLGRVRSFLSGSDGSLWLGTWEGGAGRLHPRYRRFLSFAGETLSRDADWQPSVYSLTEHHDQLWIGTPQGAFKVDANTFALQVSAGTEHRSVHAMASNGDLLWLGTDDGLFVHREGLGSRRFEQLQTLLHSRIARLVTDGDRLWIAAALQGVFVVDTSSNQVLAQSQFAGTVNHIGILDDDFVLVSASDGLYWFDRNTFALLHRTEVDTAGKAGKLPGRPSGFYVDGQGRIWVSAYGAGLVQLTLPADRLPAHVQINQATDEHALINLGMNSVIGDQNGLLWLASDRGITRFDPDSGETRHFDDSDGALARGYYFAARQRLHNGWIALGSKHGFTVFDPTQNFEPQLPRPPLVTSLETQGKPVHPSSPEAPSPLPKAVHLLQSLQLPPGWGRNLLFKVTSPTFVEPKELRYRYRLAGFDSEWLEVDADRRLITYTNVAPGEYRLQLQAVGRNGQGSAVHTVDLSIAPLWWQSTAARVAFVLLVLALLALAYRARIRHLAMQRAALERLIQERTESLQRAHRQAEQSLEALKATQEELVRAEKLSALGQLVAGVAHEVNTPIGVAVTAISHISQQLGLLQKHVQSGRMTKKDFEQQIGEAIDGAHLVERNLDRAADLIRSFKQVSVDRSSDQRRQFELDILLSQLLQSLKILWRHRPIEMVIECPEKLSLDSFPGALGQVLTNLTQNALLHAYSADQAGRLSITCRALEDNWVEICFADDGCGIGAELLPKIFEPFFTTRRNEGGTGLGLHIVHNLVTDVLGGRLRVRSQPGKGTSIYIELPRRAPA